MREEIIFAGFGGQGIMLMGKLAAYTAMKTGKFCTWMPCYGAEVRGGTAHSMVIISDEPIACPVVKEPSVCIAMNKPSVNKFKNRVKKNGMIVVNKSMAETDFTRNDIEILTIPATEIAFDLGNPKIANMVMLGAVLAKRKIFSSEKLIKELRNAMPWASEAIIDMNVKAIKKGYEYIKRTETRKQIK